MQEYIEYTEYTIHRIYQEHCCCLRIIIIDIIDYNRYINNNSIAELSVFVGC